MDRDTLISELQFKAVRSSGSGGQHVNKVATKVALEFDLEASKGLTSDEKNVLKTALKTRLTNDYRLLLQCGETRSQHRNKELVNKRLIELLTISLIQPKDRKSTKPTRSSVRKRLDSKKKHSEKKKNRQKPNIN